MSYAQRAAEAQLSFSLRLDARRARVSLLMAAYSQLL